AKAVGALLALGAGAATSVSGAVASRLTVGGTLGAPTAAGTAELASPRITQTVPACPEPKGRTLAFGTLRLADLSWDAGRLGSRAVTTSVGGGTIATGLTVTLDHGARVALDNLAVKALPLETVLVDFLCLGYAVSGPLDLAGTLAFDSVRLAKTLSGAGQLRIGRGRVVGRQALRLEEHTSELQSLRHLVCRLLLEKKNQADAVRHPGGRARDRRLFRRVFRAAPRHVLPGRVPRDRVLERAPCDDLPRRLATVA